MDMETVKGGVTSRTLLKTEGLRHPFKFPLGLNELGCDPVMRERNVIRAITFVRVSHPPRRS
jgi:hypothetical protein